MSNDKLIPELRFPEFKNDGEWKKEKLGDGLSLNPQYGINAPAVPFSKKLPTYLRITDISEDGRFLSKEKVSVDREVIENNYLSDGDIVLARTGASVGKSYKYRPEDGRLVFAGFLIRLKPNSIKLSSDFLFQFLATNQYWKWVSFISARSGQPGINATEYSLLPICLPPNNTEQHKIASCLSSLDEVIAAHSQKLELLKNHKKGLMQNLFPQEGEKVPKYRFKEFEEDGEWMETTVENNCEIKGRIGYRGYTTQDIVGQGEGALVLGGKHIQNQLLELKDPTYLSWDKYYESPEIMVEVGHIIFSQRGTLGDCAIIDREIGPATINPSMVLIKNITCDARFFYYILIGDCIQEEVRKNRSKGAIPMLSQKQIKGFSFLIPKPKEQQKIASCLSSLDALITAQAEKIAQLKLHKKGLMQGLFPKINN